MALSILDIGSGPNSVADLIFAHEEDRAVTRLDANPENNPDFVHDIREPLPAELLGKFDVVYVSHVLEHIERHRVFEVVKNLAKACKQTGELWVIVPAMEWAAMQLLGEHPSPAWHPMVYGGQHNEWDFHKCGFTLYGLRRMMEHCGLVTKKAWQSPLTITMSEREYPALQNIVVGMYVSDPVATG